MHYVNTVTVAPLCCVFTA